MVKIMFTTLVIHGMMRLYIIHNHKYFLLPKKMKKEKKKQITVEYAVEPA